ncbi:hypothetical protein GCM10009850_054750 [Nonomuraea monospora]|uniref:Uncharacterized protein n=1 Tax=Nonomuraea monospora TaxID=568818 RepID=A0ABN3CKN5_9ACTN
MDGSSRNIQKPFSGQFGNGENGAIDPLGENAMPKLKSVIAGLAISTALTGGVVSVGAATTLASADAATQVSTGTSVLAGNHCGWGWRRCGWGWGNRGHRHHRMRVKIKVYNKNYNRNPHHEPRSERRTSDDTKTD